MALPILVYSVEQILHADHVPAIPLEMLTPDYVLGRAIWPYLTAASYAVAGVMLLIGRKRRAAAIWLGATVLIVVLFVYVPIARVQRASIEGFNYFADTLMFCGTILLVSSSE